MFRPPFRGYGSPQIHALGEIALDLALRDMGLDPVAVRVVKIVAPGARELWQGLHLGNARGADCLNLGAEAFSWAERRAAVVKRGRFRRGVGMAAATHINGCFPGEDEATTATLRLLADGRVELVCALHDLGCGSDTSLAQIAAEVLGLCAGEIVIATADTDTCPYDLGTRASRMTYIAGEAVRPPQPTNVNDRGIGTPYFAQKDHEKSQFRALSSSKRTDLLRNAMVHGVASGTVLFEQGDVPNFQLIVLSGSARRKVVTPPRESTETAWVLTPGPA